MSFVRLDSRGIEKAQVLMFLVRTRHHLVPVPNMYKHWPGSEPPGDSINQSFMAVPLHLAVSRVIGKVSTCILNRM